MHVTERIQDETLVLIISGRGDVLFPKSFSSYRE